MTAVKIFNNHHHYTLLKPAVAQVVSYIVNMEHQDVQSITFIASDDKTLNEMKIKLFGIDQLTDTISINYNEIDQPVEGEIYLSLDRIEDNAHTFKVTFEKELALVIIHSILHLLGYKDDNLNDKKQMQALQNFYIQQIKLPRLYRQRRIPPNYE
ncbi:MAG TPA: rRNA maturation RNase YbeY [Candidatus Marinimicrobia bacterium]|mgnify:FL=1|nr:rRNA maturation RNase YbeY [Candidatus Neomarinimicrobiota bacterium]HRS51401.1 rRNA maturation RNase YbeY [Candidatus Neomarinimicrobiota bacterium]HRU92227.1 rRNA maturation RNase YbeY [Candidatus Neomarinimicrobiota bacterium]